MVDVNGTGEDAAMDGELERVRPIPRISIQAFCETEAVAEAVEQAAADRRMVKAHLRVHMGGIRAAAEHYASAPTPNLVMLESRVGAPQLLEDLEALADVCDPGSKVVIIGHTNDVTLYRELIRRGISEYLVSPVSMGDILSVIANLFVAPDAEPLGRTLAFVGAKGGVGSSTIAHNVAWSISQLFSTDVVLADLDLPFGTANINFDQDPPQGIAEAIFSADRMDDVFLDRLLTKCTDHLSLLAAPSILDRTYDFSADAFNPLIETAQRGAPIVVLDVPHTWNEWTKTVLALSDEIVITATPDLPNLRNAKNLVEMLKRMRPNDRSPRLILNQLAIPKRPEISSFEFAEPLEMEPLAEIAFDPAVFGAAANNGRMIGETDPKHSAVEAFHRVAHAITGRGEAKRAKRASPFDLFTRLRRRQPALAAKNG
ncbi:AAA family ATPase [Consotaella salsifontis]|uniref:Pilus assembly protein CpaE n=1 Tax=Consotaella salsifontis TaxID=1365950 RepID=A0A1T4S0V0_9HYPH|nr:CpaE family protein [Consotaella salsifontis]SKA21787.1 pilus assembly protein CpaE [Consotaella salsifontis]